MNLFPVENVGILKFELRNVHGENIFIIYDMVIINMLYV